MFIIFLINNTLPETNIAPGNDWNTIGSFWGPVGRGRLPHLIIRSEQHVLLVSGGGGGGVIKGCCPKLKLDDAYIIV